MISAGVVGRPSYGSPDVVRVDRSPTARHAWGAFIECLRGQTPFGSPISLRRVIQSNEGFRGRIPTAPLLKPIAQQFLAVRTLWQRAIYRMQEESMSVADRLAWARATGRARREFILQEKASEMHRCVAPIVFVAPKATYRTCKTLICPWCHLRRSVRILSEIPNKKDYCFAAFERVVSATDFPDATLETVKRFVGRIRRRCRACVRTIVAAPVEGGWFFYAAVFCKREDAASGEEWRHPKSFREILRCVNPYPPTYLTGDGDRLAELINSMRTFAPVTKSRGLDYGLNPSKQDD